MVSEISPTLKRWSTMMCELKGVISRVVAADDPEAVEVRKSWPGARAVYGESTYPLALPALTAAHELIRAAASTEREAITHARGQGKTWTEIGTALGETFANAAKEHGVRLPVAAYDYAVYRILPGERLEWTVGKPDTFSYYCWTCGERVSDSHPDNCEVEQGHTTDCARARRRVR